MKTTSFVNNQWTPATSSHFQNINPARPLEALETYSTASEELIDNAINVAQSAFLSWKRTPAPQRSDALLRVADRIRIRVEDIGRDMAIEEGKTLAEGIQEAQNAAAQFAYAASTALQPYGSVVNARDARTSLLYSVREPLGVVLAITPWNFPISIPAWKIAHALASGNTVVWKPAELTPRTSIHLATAMEEANLPPGVFNMLLGPGSEIGARLIRDRRLSAITFTGSNRVGRFIAQQLAPIGTKLQLELGGSNPAVVLDDADLSRAATEIANGAFLSSGQKCTATARVIAHHHIYNQLVEAICDTVRTWKTSDPLLPDTKLGPVASHQQFNHVLSCISHLPPKALVLGSSEPDPTSNGYFISPHIALDPNNLYGKNEAEIFGPLTTVSRVDSYDEAVATANATPFGLSASIFTKDISKALSFAEDCQAGVVKINKATTGNELHVPFGGHKESGSGSSEMGWASREFFTQWKTVYLDR